MGFNWKDLTVKRFYGLDLKTNILDVIDGRSLDMDNVYLNGSGFTSKRPGTELMFSADETGAIEIDELGTAKIAGTKYYFKFVDGKFKYSLGLLDAVNVIEPIPAISTENQIWWAVLDDKLFFVDGVNVLRYFDGINIHNSILLERPTAALTTSDVNTGFDFTYTVDNGLGESPACPTVLKNKGSAASVTVDGNTGPQTLVVGNKIRVYSKKTGVEIFKNVTKTTGTHANGFYSFDEVGGYLQLTSVAATYTVETVAITDDQAQLYTERGLAVNKSAITGLTGITKHYSRLVGWKGSHVYNSKVSNPHSWPNDAAPKNAFVYSYLDGDGENISVCVSYRESLFVMKPSNVAVFAGIGPSDEGKSAYSLRRLETNGKGCIAPKSAFTIGEKQRTFLVYLSRQGFMATDGSAPVEIGQGIERVIQAQAETTLALSYGMHDKRLGLYCCAVGAPGARTIYVFDVRQDLINNEPMYYGWFKWNSGLSNIKCMYFDGDRALFGQYDGICLAQRVTRTSSDFRDPFYAYFDPVDVNVDTNQIFVGKTFLTGEEVKIRSNDQLPDGIVNGTTYYVIAEPDNEGVIRLADSLANAQAGIEIDITSQGAGTHSIYGSQAIAAYYTTNWLAFGKPFLVKKLGKPGIIFNAAAEKINLTIETAYNWVEQFRDLKVILGGAVDEWGNDGWGFFEWNGRRVATPRNYGLRKRKVRSIRFKFSNDVLDQDFDLLGIYLRFDYLRNRGKFVNAA